MGEQKLTSSQNAQSVHMRNSFVTVSVPLLVNDPKGLFTLYEFITVTVNVIIMTVVPLIFMDTDGQNGWHTHFAHQNNV